MSDVPEVIQEVVAIAMAEAMHARAEALAPVHLLIAVCKQDVPPLRRAFASIGLDPVALRRRARWFTHAAGPKREEGPPRFSDRARRTVERAVIAADDEGRPPHVGDVLVALLGAPDPEVDVVIRCERLPVEALVAALVAEFGRARPGEMASPAAARPGLVGRLGKDYSALAREGRLDPMVGRRRELKEMLRILLRRQKNNPLLVGEAGVGKTALVEGLALYAAGDDAPEAVRRLTIVEISIASLVAGAKYRGDLEERLDTLVKEAEADPDLVVFFDEVHTLAGAGAAGDAMDAANILKPALARGAFRCIGATTPAEYRRRIEGEEALARRFQPVRVEEPTPVEALEILTALRPHYEEHHEVRLTDDALRAAVDLSVRYLPARRLPDKARDLIDQAAVAKRIRTLGPGPGVATVGFFPPETVDREDVAAVVAEWTGVPLERLGADGRARIAGLEAALGRRVVGQDHAVQAVARVVRTAFAGMGRPDRPLGVFLFAGPTGVGKTELARALAELLFDDERRIVRLDMSEYAEEHSAAKLIGAPPGYVGYEDGGRLTDPVRQSPFSVVLLDEIDKAHPKVFDLFLQVFDEGRLTDSRGRTTDFRNTILVMTSNLAVEEAGAPPRVGFGVGAGGRARDSAPSATAAEELRSSLASRYRPEFVNRIDEIVVFRSLGASDVRRIVDKLIDGVARRLAERGVRIVVADTGYEALVGLGYHPGRGVRELERVVEHLVVQPIAERVLRGDVPDGATVVVEGSDGAVDLRVDPVVA